MRITRATYICLERAGLVDTGGPIIPARLGAVKGIKRWLEENVVLLLRQNTDLRKRVESLQAHSINQQQQLVQAKELIATLTLR